MALHDFGARADDVVVMYPKSKAESEIEQVINKRRMNMILCGLETNLSYIVLLGGNSKGYMLRR